MEKSTLRHLSARVIAVIVVFAVIVVAVVWFIRPSAPATNKLSIECGSTNLMSGWPTTMVMPPDSCIVDAANRGQPARFSVRSASQVESKRKTSDGYVIPEPIVTTYLVVGPHNVAITTDETAAGGRRKTLHCAGLELGTPLPRAVEPCTP